MDLVNLIKSQLTSTKLESQMPSATRLSQILYATGVLHMPIRTLKS
jgi:hypothetical protein